MKVLLVDDDENIRQLLELSLRFALPEIEVTHAEEGDQALELCAELQPDALIVDGRLPGISGDALGLALRKLVPAAKIVSFTGTDGEVVEWADVRVVKASPKAVERVIAEITGGD